MLTACNNSEDVIVYSYTERSVEDVTIFTIYHDHPSTLPDTLVVV
jgi:hypothetical protein